MGILDRFRNKSPGGMRLDFITSQGNGFYAWDGKIYQSDIVRSCIRPKVKAMGKLVAKHIMETMDKDGNTSIKVNPDPAIKFLLEDPNPYMSPQKLYEKMAVQLAINGNAFAVILRNSEGMPIEIYPLNSSSGVEAIYNRYGELFLKFNFCSGKAYTFPYSDIIHLRHDYNENDIFGDSIVPALRPLMNVVSTTDQGIIWAIKNSGVVRWLLKYGQSLRPEDLKKNSEDFAKNYLVLDNDNVGVAAVDAKAEAIQIKPYEYVPNAAQMKETRERIYSLLGTNEKIVQSTYDEDEWVSYYEAEIEPDVIDMTSEFTRKIFNRHRRSFGNKIIFESAPLTTAGMKTKLNLVQLVDRGIMVPNEHRAILGYAPITGGDVPIRRLDMASVDEEGKTIKEKEVEEDNES